MLLAAGYLGNFICNPSDCNGFKFFLVSADSKLAAAVVSKHHQAACVVNDSGVVRATVDA